MQAEMCHCKITRCVVFDEVLPTSKIAEVAHNAATMNDDEWLKYVASLIPGATVGQED
jgi:hypothetical protein